MWPPAILADSRPTILPTSTALTAVVQGLLSFFSLQTPWLGKGATTRRKDKVVSRGSQVAQRLHGQAPSDSIAPVIGYCLTREL